jgi:endonuclease YncB( thermonuclease family)
MSRRAEPHAVPILALLALIALATAACPFQAAADPTPNGVQATVVRAIDGDTIQVFVNGRTEAVRYIGINTPEIDHPTKGREPGGEEARAVNRELVEGRAVTLVFDVQHRDRYGRLLAYVYVGGLFVNAELVRRGVAEVATFPPNVRHREEFVALQRQAMAGKAGLWADPDNGKHYRPHGSGVFANKRTQSYFHVDDPSRGLLTADSWEFYETAHDAAKAGYQPSFSYRDYSRDEHVRIFGSPVAVGGSSGAGTASGSGPTYRGYSGYSGYAGSGGASPGTDVPVKGYTRGDGTYVAPHTRSAPGTGGGSHGGGRR